MAAGKLFIGRQVRELRLSTGATQVQFAERLGISTSYLNHIESNQRPVSATVLIALMDKFKMDFSELASGETDRLLSALSETLKDPIFEGYSPTLQELKLITHNAPGFAHALIAAHHAYRINSEQLVSLDRELGRGLTEITPYEEVRDFFHFVDNYIHELDIAAEALAGELRIRQDPRTALICWLETQFKVNIGMGPASAPLREFDSRHKRLTLNAFSPPHTQTFQLAVFAAQMAAADTVASIVESAGLRLSLIHI